MSGILTTILLLFSFITTLALIYGESRTRSKTEPTQSTQDLLWLWIYTQNMAHDAILEDSEDEFKRGYVEAMEDVRWGIEFIDNFNNKELTEDESI